MEFDSENDSPKNNSVPKHDIVLRGRSAHTGRRVFLKSGEDKQKETKGERERGSKRMIQGDMEDKELIETKRCGQRERQSKSWKRWEEKRKDTRGEKEMKEREGERYRRGHEDFN